jgi:hypothetical protein
MSSQVAQNNGVIGDEGPLSHNLATSSKEALDSPAKAR